MKTTIVQIREYDFEVPDGHSAEPTGDGKIVLRDGKGRASSYSLLNQTVGPDEERFELDSKVPPTFIVGEAYPLPLEAEELGRLLVLWDAKFADRSGYTALREQCGPNRLDLFREMRRALKRT